MIHLYLFILLSFLSTSLTWAQSYQLSRQKQPLIEAGVGFGYANLPQYEGAKERREVGLPFPTFIYRGDIIRADEDGGLRGRVKFSNRFEINGSFGLSLPVDSRNIQARESMVDLDPMFEIGPGFIYHIIKSSADTPYSLSINFAARYAFTTDLQLTHGRGWVVNPIIYSNIKLSDKFSLFTSISKKWAEKSYQQYYYDVSENDVSPVRFQYQAEGGVLTSRFASFVAYQPNKKIAWALGFIYSNYEDAANRTSPLHVEDENYSMILGFSYWFYQSKEVVSLPSA